MLIVGKQSGRKLRRPQQVLPGHGYSLRATIDLDHLRPLSIKIADQTFAAPSHRGRRLKVGKGDHEWFFGDVLQLVIVAAELVSKCLSEPQCCRPEEDFLASGGHCGE